MDKENIKISMSNPDNPQSAIPILGKAYPTRKKGYYGVKTFAIIKTLYAVVCPQCGKIISVKPEEEGVLECLCNTCHSVIILKAVKEQETDNVDKSSSNSEDFIKEPEMPTQEPEKDKKKPEIITEKYKLNEGKEANAKLVWWSITGRKKYILREGKNYVGRKDKERPSDISLNDEYASAQSICIEVKKKYKGYDFLLEVKRATNPVLVAGKECSIGSSFELNYGDTIVLGNTTLTLKPIKT